MIVSVYHYSNMYSAAYQYTSMWTPQLFSEYVSSGISFLLLWTSQVDVMSSLMPLTILFPRSQAIFMVLKKHLLN